MWRVVFAKQARKDAKRISSAGLHQKAEILLDILRKNPYQTPPPFEKLIGYLTGAYSRRINMQHRLVYQVLDEANVVKVLRMWTHYELSRITSALSSRRAFVATKKGD
jgi:toxin YoeB